MLCSIKVHITFFGYGSQAKRIKKYCQKFFENHEKIQYSGIVRKNFKNNDIKLFSNIEDCIYQNGLIDCIFICTNNSSHLQVFKECIHKKIPYIYVEKPAIGVEDYLESKRKINNIKYIQIGYHFNYQEAFISLEKLVKSDELGKLLKFEIFYGHGLAFKDQFQNSWRANEKDALLDTVLCHLVNLSIRIGNIERLRDFIFSQIPNIKNGILDTANLAFTNEKGSLFSLTSSWGSPLEKSVKAYFDNGIWEYNFNDLIIKSPRDVFDENGMFKSPPSVISPISFNGIQSSIYNFLEVVQKDLSADYQLNNSKKTSEILNLLKSEHQIKY